MTSDRNDRPERPERDSRPERGERSQGARGGRPGRAAQPLGRGQRDAPGTERPEWQTRVARPIDERRDKSPLIPAEITPEDLEYGVRVQLKTLSPENAEMVARHLAMVPLLMDSDPQLAHRHAMAASQRAGRIAVVRETSGITAYRVGDYALALRELLTFRRISGSNQQLPIMVDSERGMGRPERALELGRSVERSTLEPEVRVNLAIALSGARLDRGENELALAELEIPELDPSKVFEYSSPLFFAYSDCLEILGRLDESKRWLNLATRASEAFLPKDEDGFEVIEEIEIPQSYEVNRDRPQRSGDRPARTGDRKPRKNFE